MSKVILEKVTKRFDSVLAVNNLSLETQEKEFLVIVGPSGCGKTTTLRLIAGLETPDSGNIYIGGKLVNDVGPGKRGVQMIFPNYALYPHMKVLSEKDYSNLNFALKIRHWMDKDIKARVEDVASRVGIEKRLFSRKPDTLSEGEKQRVAIGRAIVVPPQVFLMDDPMTNLDPPRRVQVREEIVKVHRELGTTTVYVTHNMADAMGMADRIAVMQDGSIIQLATPEELYYHPLNDFVQDFIRAFDSALSWKGRR